MAGKEAIVTLEAQDETEAGDKGEEAGRGKPEHGEQEAGTGESGRSPGDEEEDEDFFMVDSVSDEIEQELPWAPPTWLRFVISWTATLTNVISCMLNGLCTSTQPPICWVYTSPPPDASHEQCPPAGLGFNATSYEPAVTCLRLDQSPVSAQQTVYAVFICAGISAVSLVIATLSVIYGYPNIPNQHKYGKMMYPYVVAWLSLLISFCFFVWYAKMLPQHLVLVCNYTLSHFFWYACIMTVLNFIMTVAMILVVHQELTREQQLLRNWLPGQLRVQDEVEDDDEELVS